LWVGAATAQDKGSIQDKYNDKDKIVPEAPGASGVTTEQLNHNTSNKHIKHVNQEKQNGTSQKHAVNEIC